MAPISQCNFQPDAAFRDPLACAKFTLDSSGVAGFFGGDTAVHGMATVNLFRWRKWGGWYNTPGSYDIAKQYGQLANWRVFKGLFPGGVHDPSKLFGLDGKVGPKFLSPRSGVRIDQTGHFAALIMRIAWSTRYTPVKSGGPERITSPVTVTVIDLPEVPEKTVYPTLSYHVSAVLAAVPIGASIGACVGCAFVADWWSFWSILLGMVANGCACFVLGSGRLAFKHPKAAHGAPRSDGIFITNAGVVVIRGEASAVNCFTRGRFYLEYKQPPIAAMNGSIADEREIRSPSERSGVDTEAKGQGKGGHKRGERTKCDRDTEGTSDGTHPNGFIIGLCSTLLTVQFLVQLLLIPQGALFGQVMFISTLAVSWLYNTYLSSIDREDAQTDLLRKILGIDERSVRKFEFGTRTAMATFACLALQGDPDDPLPDSSSMVWDALLPSNTEVWTRWRTVVNAKLRVGQPWTVQPHDYKGRAGPKGEGEELDEGNQNLLRALLNDAQVAHSRYLEEYGVQG
ncbi:hypothetical protein GSI_08752 [Ganoderma sinense ZZ0214-1]|uniref:Uncharacterized protein n=1 Tax=Ganoderma sinense ZZ0214-1 TaxID=1077348 RepID=A0A2G8S579_9APHY|nr:hypothetical protein GSI_08752 [Ganoderma sinense ZZ0214-1]